MSIKYKLIFAILSLIAVLQLFSSYIQYHQIRDILFSQIEGEAQVAISPMTTNLNDQIMQFSESENVNDFLNAYLELRGITDFPEIIKSQNGLIDLMFIGNNLKIIGHQDSGKIGTEIPASLKSFADSLKIDAIREGSNIFVLIPFMVKGEKYGAILMQYDDSRLVSERSKLINNMMLILLFFMILGLVMTIVISNRLIRPIMDLKDVFHAIANGDLEKFIDTSRKDEIGSLSESFSIMRNSIKEKIFTIEKYNQMLESIVQERTQELTQKNLDIKSILENIKQGIFTIREGGHINPDYSAYLEDLFKDVDIKNSKIGDILFQNSNLNIDQVDQINNVIFCCLEQEKINFVLNNHLLPNEIIKEVDDKKHTLEIEWDAITGDDGLVTKILVVVRDVTEYRELKLESERQKKQIEMIDQILSISLDKFDSFYESNKSLVAENKNIISNKTNDLKQIVDMFINLHTLKGNARTYGLSHLASKAHFAEKYLSDLKSMNNLEIDYEKLHGDIAVIEEVFQDYSKARQRLENRDIRIEDQKNKEFTQIFDNKVSSLKSTSDPKALTKLFEELSQARVLSATCSLNEVVHDILLSIPQLAKDLGKAHPKIEILDNGYRFAAGCSSALSNSLMHLFRNSLDHGIEAAEERLNKGKSPSGRIKIAVSKSAHHILLAFEDDGQGLNIDKLKEGPSDEGKSDAEIAEKIFKAGVSTKESITEISGRGIGMEAVRQYLSTIGGTIELVLGEKKFGSVPIKFLINLPATTCIYLESAPLSRHAKTV